MQQRKLIDAMPINVIRHTRWILLCLPMFGSFAATVLAQTSSDPMEACFRMSDRDAKLACFDNEMQRRHALAAREPATAPTAPAATSAPPATNANSSIKTAKQGPPDDTIGLDGKQLIRKRKEEGIQPKAVQPMVAVIATLKQRPGHLYYFELENGQVWESTDTEGDLFLGPHETVLIRPGILGAFFLKTQDGKSIRVHRLR
ncbi:MAG TPA: hypothetical protein VIY90_19450 [Steroidobacteraceae bacterium]